jgi:DNA-binding MarR family transcriptional regulator
MPESIDTAKEIVKIRHEIQDIQQSQEADMHMNEEKYKNMVFQHLKGKPFVAKVYLAVDGLISQKEIGIVLKAKQPNVSTAIDFLVSKGLIVGLDQTKDRSPIYAKPRWAKALRIEDFVRTEIIPTPEEQEQVQPPTGDRSSPPDS